MGAVSNLYRVKDDKIVCQLCRHYCQLKKGQVGICGVNKNSNGKLENLVYGKVSAINVDPIEKKPLYHFLPGTTALSIGTVGCNFKCPFCQNWQISQSKDIDSSYRITPQEIVDLAIKYGSKTIAYTYNEPTIFWPFAKDIALLAKEKGIKNIFVSNGFESRKVIEDMDGVIDAFNIDIKGFNSSYYKKVLKGGLDGVLDTLKLLKEKNFWVECTTLIVPGDNDSSKEINSIAKFIANDLDIDTPWHISAFHPDYKVLDKDSTPINTLKKAYQIGKEAGLNYIYMGNVALPSDTVCPNCNNILIKRAGYNIIKNDIVGGKCKYCHKNIAGVWR